MSFHPRRRRPPPTCHPGRFHLRLCCQNSIPRIRTPTQRLPACIVVRAFLIVPPSSRVRARSRPPAIPSCALPW
jgi:hypothetical protein